MTRFVLQRARHGVLSIIGIVVLVFVLSRLTGSPARLYLPEDATAEMVAQFNAQNGFDKPVVVQLLSYLKGTVQLDFGHSLLYGEPALNVVLARYPATLLLAFFSMLIATTLGVVFGSLAAARKNSFADKVSRVTSLGALSVPDFWVGIMGIAVFAVYLGILPTSGAAGPQYWILPVLTLILRPVGILAQVVRTSMVDALAADYVRVAKSKGVTERAIVFKHALRNAAIPIVTVAGVLMAGVVNGALVVETVFGWPGIGNLMVTAIHGRDFAVIQAVVLVTGTAIIVLNFGIDLAYSWLDPQIRLGR
ncbi:ABC transporter permease [Kribbella sp. NPDC058245]|uniref:ABC transporter permease n=1 Tax=Kribbella sp. NPDC058245 TaxID=3346399 RepID=UPI0036E00AE9